MTQEIMSEIWKPIPICNGTYEASILGRIRNTRLKKILKPSPFRGYEKVSVSINGKHISKFVHRLVLSAFLGESESVIDHINDIKSDNRLSNLRYVTQRENAVKHNLKKNQFTGASFNKKRQMWVSYIYYGYDKKHLGYFNTQQDAHDAYMSEITKEGQQ